MAAKGHMSEAKSDEEQTEIHRRYSASGDQKVKDTRAAGAQAKVKPGCGPTAETHSANVARIRNVQGIFFG